ncbi:YihA family ribosome biogenesis GTP-binding protein, partial [Aquimarina litoralis]|nr:YihA family ribosome biogenesis GTP-binding protein [Aquimarina litoralis]
LVSAFVLVDCRHEPQKIDLEFMQWLGENQIPFSIIFTKADKLTKTKLPQNIGAYITEMLKYWEEMPNYFITSSSNGLGKEDVLNYIEEINNQLANS